MIAFATSLLATFPAKVAARYVPLPIEINAYSGTIWNGSGSLAGGHVVRWHVDARATLLSLAPRLEVAVAGPGTRLSAGVALRGTHDLRLTDLGGTLAWPLVAALAPDLGFACAATATLTGIDLHIVPGSPTGTGSLTAGPGTCSESGGGEPVLVPDLAGTLTTGDDGLHLVVARGDTPDAPLAEIALTNGGSVVATLHPEGAALIPDMPTSGDTTVEYPLPW